MKENYLLILSLLLNLGSVLNYLNRKRKIKEEIKKRKIEQEKQKRIEKMIKNKMEKKIKDWII